MAAVSHGGRPADPGLAGWTASVVPGPSTLAVLGVKAGPLAGLPVIVEARGPQESHVVALLTPDKQVGIQAAGVHEVRARE